MKPVAQTDPELSSVLNRYGCRFMSLLAIPQIEAGEFFMAPVVQEIYDQACEIGGVVTNPYTALCGPNEAWIIDEGFRRLDVDKRGIQIGEIRGDVPFLWNNKQAESFDYVVAHWKTLGADGHFTLLDRKREEIYDPFDARQATYVLKKLEIIRELIYRVW